MLVTGASSGIGLATAHAFGKAGAKLVLHGRDAARLSAVADAIIAEGGSAVTMTGEAGSEETQKVLVELALSTYGALHIAFNNAGVYNLDKIVDLTSQAVDNVLNTNVKSVIYGLKYQLPVSSHIGMMMGAAAERPANAQCGSRNALPAFPSSHLSTVSPPPLTLVRMHSVLFLSYSLSLSRPSARAAARAIGV